MYTLCVAGAVNTQDFVSQFFMHYISNKIFIYSVGHIHVETPQAKTNFKNGYCKNDPSSELVCRRPKEPEEQLV